MKDELIKQAGFSSTYEKDRLYTLIDLTLNECLKSIKDTPTVDTFITSDMNTVNLIIQHSLDQIIKKFNLPTEKKE